jgi:mRNA interferase RelE/StbE
LVWKVELTDTARRTLKKLDKPAAKRITTYLHELGLHTDPRTKGKALLGDFQGYWRYRVGDYRIVCEMKDEKVVVLVVRIGHRKEVYE